MEKVLSVPTLQPIDTRVNCPNRGKGYLVLSADGSVRKLELREGFETVFGIAVLCPQCLIKNQAKEPGFNIRFIE